MKKNVYVSILILLFFAGTGVLGALDYGLYVQAGNVVYVVDRDSNEHVGSYALQKTGSASVTPTPGGISVYVPASDSLEVFAAETGQAEAQFADDWVNIAGVSFTPTGERLFILDRGTDSLLVYRHSRLTLERQGAVPFPVGESGDLVFNGRGTRYFTLGRAEGSEGSALINGDGLNGRIISSIDLGFTAETLTISANDRFAWAAGNTDAAVVDLRKNKIVRKLQGSFNPESLVLEAQGRRALILNEEGSEIQLFNSQNGQSLATAPVPSGYVSLLLDEYDTPWLVPASTADPFLRLTIASNSNTRIETEEVSIAGLPAGLAVEQVVFASVKSGGNFACF